MRPFALAVSKLLCSVVLTVMLVLELTPSILQAEPVVAVLAEDAAPNQVMGTMRFEPSSLLAVSSGSLATSTGGDQTDVFQQEMARLGHIDGKNIRFERVFADAGALALRAAELVDRRVSVLVTIGTRPTIAARRAVLQLSMWTPIVMVGVGDPVELGFANSLARPGEFVTGTSFLASDSVSKGLELLKEAVPTATTIGALLNPDNAASELAFKRTGDDAARLQLRLKAFPARTYKDLLEFFESLKYGRRPHGLIVINDALFNRSASILVGQIRAARLPAVFQVRQYVQLGGLMAYGPNVNQLYRRAAHLTHRILEGAKPADLPIEQPNTFELLLNLKTAKALGLAIPQSLLVRADEIIE